MKTAQKRIEAIREHGYELDFTITFNHAIEIYKKTFLMAGFTLLILLVVTAAIVLVGIGNVIELPNQNMQNILDFQLQHFSATGIVVYFFSMAALTALFAPVNAGLIKICYEAEMERPFSIGTAFQYYKAPYFLPLVLATLIIAVISLAINTALEFVGIQLVGTIISFLVGISTCMTIPLIIFGNLNASEAIRGSIIVISRHPLTILALIVVASIVAALGLIGCCIGIVFTIPIVNAAYYSIYVHSVGIEDNTGNEE